jgi:hypothetical protein
MLEMSAMQGTDSVVTAGARKVAKPGLLPGIGYSEDVPDGVELRWRSGVMVTRR